MKCLKEYVGVQRIDWEVMREFFLSLETVALCTPVALATLLMDPRARRSDRIVSLVGLLILFILMVYVA
jgi:hypothetical protein